MTQRTTMTAGGMGVGMNTIRRGMSRSGLSRSASRGLGIGGGQATQLDLQKLHSMPPPGHNGTPPYSRSRLGTANTFARSPSETDTARQERLAHVREKRAQGMQKLLRLAEHGMSPPTPVLQGMGLKGVHSVSHNTLFVE